MVEGVLSFEALMGELMMGARRELGRGQGWCHGSVVVILVKPPKGDIRPSLIGLNMGCAWVVPCFFDLPAYHDG